MPKKNDARMDQAFAALLSADDAKALEAITHIEEYGNADTIIPLLEVLARTEVPARQSRIVALLNEVKAKEAGAELAKALDLPELASVRKTVIATYWNAGVDAAPYTERLIRCAVEGDAMETFEVLTVLENQEVLPEKAVLKGIKTVSAAIAKNTDDYKGAMLGSLLVELKARVGKDDDQTTLDL